MPTDLESKSIPPNPSHSHSETTSHDEIYLRKPCVDNPARWYFVLKNELYSRTPSRKQQINPVWLSDFVFHFCQYYPEEAGEILNSKIWQWWNSDVSSLLIDAGADLNVISKKSSYPTLFNAIRSVVPPEVLSKLINRAKHPANYAAYNEERNGVTYTIMLVCALSGDKQKLAVLVEKYPNEVNPTLKSLREMHQRMIAENSSTLFSCEFRDYDFFEGDKKKMFYTLQDVSNASTHLLQIENENKYKISAAHRASYAALYQGIKDSTKKEVEHEDKRIICRNL